MVDEAESLQSCSLDDLTESEAPDLDRLVAEISGDSDSGTLGKTLHLSRFSSAELRAALGPPETMKKKCGASSRHRRGPPAAACLNE